VTNGHSCVSNFGFFLEELTIGQFRGVTRALGGGGYILSGKSLGWVAFESYFLRSPNSPSQLSQS